MPFPGPTLSPIGRTAVRAAAASLPALIVADGAVNYWAMTEASGVGVTTLAPTVGAASITLGTSTAKPTLGAAGQVGTAVQFDGVDDFASVALDLSAHDMLTFECLFYWDAYANDDDLLMEFSPNFNATSGTFLVDPDSIDGNFSVTASSNGYSVANLARPTGAAWHHLVFRVDFSITVAQVADVLIDGVAQSISRPGAFNGGQVRTFADTTLYLMSRAGSSLFGAGRMQHLAIYPSLSDARARAHAQAAGLA